MAVLTDSARREIWVEFMQRMQANGLLKADMRAAVDAADAWRSANGASFNAALPQPFRGAASAADKAMLLMLVVARAQLDGV